MRRILRSHLRRGPRWVKTWPPVTRLSLFATTFSAAAILSLVVACGDLKHAGPTASEGEEGSSESTSPTTPGASSSSGSTAGGSTSGGSSSSSGSTATPASGATGPGPKGALPNGYCCQMDSECRYRNCADIGGGQKACLDECRSNSACQRPDLMTFTCNTSTDTCAPPAGFTCIEASAFLRGTRVTGDCCSATGNGLSGLECEGGRCIAWGPDTNPFVCTNACSVPNDCGPGFVCQMQVGFCIPGNDPYTCK